MTDLERAILHIKTRADAWAVREVEQALSQELTFDDECQKDMDEAWEQIQKKRKRIPVTLDLTPCDDAISRADAQTEIMMSKSLVSFDRDIWIKTKDAVQIIRELPSVTPKPIECDDAVSRDAVMGLVAREHTEWDDLYIDIAKLPSVTQKGDVKNV